MENNIEKIFKGLQTEGEILERKKYKEEKFGVVRNPKYPTLDEQEGNYGDDENPEQKIEDIENGGDKIKEGGSGEDNNVFLSH